MNMSPIKKIILALAAVSIVFSIVTANNLTTVMMIMSSRKMNAGQQNGSAVVQQQNDNQQSADNGGSSNDSSYTDGGSSNDSSATNNGSSNDSSATNNGSSNDSSASNGGSSASNGGSSASNNSGSSNNASNGASNSSTPAGNSGSSNAGATTGKPSSKAEIVAYFNKAVNSVKSSAKTVEQKNVTNYLAGQAETGGLSTIYKTLGGDSWLDGMLQDNSQGAATYTGADIKAKFPVEGQDWSSKLTEADVKSANCTESNGVYTITVTTFADAKSTNVKVGEGHAPKAFNVVLPGVVNDNIPGIAKSLSGEASMAYPESTAKITVDAKTGNVITADYDLKWTINFDKMSVVLPFGTKASYTVKY